MPDEVNSRPAPPRELHERLYRELMIAERLVDTVHFDLRKTPPAIWLEGANDLIQMYAEAFAELSAESLLRSREQELERVRGTLLFAQSVIEGAEGANIEYRVALELSELYKRIKAALEPPK